MCLTHPLVWVSRVIHSGPHPRCYHDCIDRCVRWKIALGYSVELLGNDFRMHLGFGTPQHPLLPRKQGVYDTLARISYGSLSHRPRNYDTMGMQAIARRFGYYGDCE